MVTAVSLLMIAYGNAGTAAAPITGRFRHRWQKRPLAPTADGHKMFRSSHSLGAHA